MRVLWTALGVGLALGAWACGPTIGDACTVASECGLGTCLQGPSLPGGYCSLGCDAGACPNGSACAPGAGPSFSDVCLLRCGEGQQCRQGYRCLGLDGGASSRVCVGG